MHSKRYERIKNFIRRAFAASATAFLCISGCCVSNMATVQIHADTFTPGQKQSFVTWLLSYFGINIYTDAQQINDDLYTAVKLAYDAYLATLQPQQQIDFDDIADLVTWDNARPNVLKLPGTVYNVLKGFANYISSQIYDPSSVEGLEIGEFETSTTGTYVTFTPNAMNPITYMYISGTGYVYRAVPTNTNVRAVAYEQSSNPVYEVYLVSTSSFKYGNSNVRSLDGTIPSMPSTASAVTYNGLTYYVGMASIYNYNDTTIYTKYVPSIPTISGSSARINRAIEYTFGSMASSGGTTLNDVFALPKPAILDDLIGAADPEQDMELDLDGSDIAYSTALTLEDIIGMINDAVDGYVLDDSYPDTAAKIVAQSQAIDNELTDVDYPNASNWEVPQPIATPQIIPLIQPECPDLSACLVAGIQDVGTSLGNVIDANSNVSNYVSVILFMGIALTILGGI